MEPSDGNYTLVDLPLEAVEVVAGYLSIRDLLACCACSQSMREVFSDNGIWRPRCDKKLCEYLIVTPCKVEPQLIIPKFMHSSLSPIPEWKMKFIHQNHLRNNWRQGMNEEEKIILYQESAKLESRSLDNSLYHQFLTSDCIIAEYPGRIEFLDVRESPAAKAASDIKTPIVGKHGFKLVAGDGIVIIIYFTLVLVYVIDLSTKESILKSIFFVEDSEKTNNVHGADFECLFKNAEANHSKKLIKTVLVDNLLVAILQGESRMHIWDVQSGLKMNTQDCPVKQTFVVEFKSAGIMNLILCVEGKKQTLETQTSSQIFLAYNLTTFKFLPFAETMKGSCQFSCTDKYVAIWENNVLSVYDYVTSKQLLSKQPIKSFCQALMNNFVFIEGTILKIFIPSRQVVKSFSLVPEPGNSLDQVHANWFEILSSKYIEIRNGSSQSFYEINDAFEMKKLSMDFWFSTCSFFLNKTSTRYIVRYGGCGYVVHFW